MLVARMLFVALFHGISGVDFQLVEGFCLLCKLHMYLED